MHLSLNYMAPGTVKIICVNLRNVVHDDKTSRTHAAGLCLTSTPSRMTGLSHHGMIDCLQLPELTSR
jgi:hypothetical protein